MRNINVIERQNVMDVTVQETGTLQNLFNVIQDNDLEVNTIEQTLTNNKLQIGTYTDERKNIVNIIEEPVFSGGDEDIELEGIGYWIIEKDFMIS